MNQRIEQWNRAILDALDALDDQGPADKDLGDIGPWRQLADAVPDHIITAALIGHPTPQDAIRILNNPDAIARLTRHWTTHPPTSDLLKRASTHPHLTQLLHAALPDLAEYGASRPASSEPLVTETITHLPSRTREDYVKMAGTEQPAYIDAFPGGRLTRQPFADGTVEVTLLITERSFANAGDAVRIKSVSSDFSVFMILLEDDCRQGVLYSRLEAHTQAILDELYPPEPITLADIREEDLAAVTAAVQWSDPDTTNAWDEAAHLLGREYLIEAVERGIEFS